MSIPPFTIDGILPPYVGSRGPGDRRQLMTPFDATPLEVVSFFGTTLKRREILAGWLTHRERIRARGMVNGFQWIDGSFVEDKVPGDVDVVTFVRRPATVRGPDALERLMRANSDTFQRDKVKAELSVDAFFVDLDGTKIGLVELTRYYCGLFSHRRGDDVWKGMIKVSMESAGEPEARDWLIANRHTPIAALARGTA